MALVELPISADGLMFRMFSHIKLNGICMSEGLTRWRVASYGSVDRCVQNPTSNPGAVIIFGQRTH